MKNSTHCGTAIEHIIYYSLKNQYNVVCTYIRHYSTLHFFAGRLNLIKCTSHIIVKADGELPTYYVVTSFVFLTAALAYFLKTFRNKQIVEYVRWHSYKICVAVPFLLIQFLN